MLSGVPLLTMGKDTRIAYIDSALSRLEPGRNLTQLSYAFTPPQDSVPGRFVVDKSRWVTFNIPPGRVWIYRREN